jgi:hypothetical protein
MATDVTSGDAAPVVEPVVAAEPTAAESAPSRLLYRREFLVVYLILAVALLAAGGVGVTMGLGSTATSSAGPWSSWRPSGGGLGAAKQIASRVGARYRQPGSGQLVDVIAKAPSVSPGSQQIPIHYVAIRGTKGKPDQIMSVSSSDSVMYSLCGLGASCAISGGKPSVARGTLVRREILELALYTFKYVGGMNSVIAFMPPKPGATPQYAVYIQKGDLATELKRPLAATLGAKTPQATTIPAAEVHTIDSTTLARTYSFTLSQAQNGDAILVLSPLPAS